MWVLLCVSVSSPCLCGENRWGKKSTTEALRSTETQRVELGYCTETRAKVGLTSATHINDAEDD
jgi:hypothetical protein